MAWNARGAQKLTASAFLARKRSLLWHELTYERFGGAHVVDPRDALARVQRASVEKRVRPVVGRGERAEQRHAGSLQAGDEVLLGHRDRRQGRRERTLRQPYEPRAAVVAAQPALGGR